MAIMLGVLLIELCILGVMIVRMQQLGMEVFILL